MAILRPKLKLERGKTYVIDQSDATNATHPFKFTADSGTSEYTSGVTATGTPGQAGAKTTFVVPSDAPDNMMYYCTAHGIGMGQKIKIFGSVPASFLWGGTRGFIIGGNRNGGGQSTNIEYLNIASPGNANNFGNLTTVTESHTSGGNKTRGIHSKGTISGQSWSAGWSADMEYHTCATLGNASDFGDKIYKASVNYCVADGTKVIWAGGQGGPASGSYNSGNNFIDYVTADTTGNSVDFGDMTNAKHSGGSTNDDTRGVFISGLIPGAYTNVIDYITMATPGNAIDFGDLHNGDGAYGPSVGVVSDNTTGVIAGGMYDTSYTVINNITKITIQTPGNSTDFGDLVSAKERQAAASDGITGIFANGYTNADNSIMKITIATPGNATDFGDTIATTNGQHSGMSGNAA